jgi:hypothetical protein
MRTHPYRFTPRPAGALLVAVAVAAAGCSENPHLTGAQVSGTVRVKNGPLTGGTIRLVAKSDPSKTASGAILGDGTYKVLNAPVGLVVAVIETESARWDPAKMMQLAASKGAPIDPDKMPKGPPLKFVPIDRRYSDFATSPLEATLGKGDNSHDFELR